MRTDLNHWLKIKLVGTESNRDAVGAKVIVATEAKNQVRFVLSSSGYLSQSSEWLHFGLGSESKIKQVQIVWPDGKTESIENVKPGQSLTITEKKHPGGSND